MADVPKSHGQTGPFVVDTGSPVTRGVNAVHTNSDKINRNCGKTGAGNICKGDRNDSSTPAADIVDETLVEDNAISKDSRGKADETRDGPFDEKWSNGPADNLCDGNDDDKNRGDPVDSIDKAISRDACHDVDTNGTESCHPTERLCEGVQHDLRSTDCANVGDEKNSDPNKEEQLLVTNESSHDVISNNDNDEGTETGERRAELATTKLLRSRDVLQHENADDEFVLTSADHNMKLQEIIEHDALSTASANWCCLCGPTSRSSSSSSACCCGRCCARCHCCCCGLFSGRDTEPDNKRFVFKWYDVPLGVGGGVLYAVDVYTDLRLAEQYIMDDHVIFGCVTLAFVLLAYVVSVVYGLREYYRLRRDRHATYRAPAYVWFLRIVGTVLMLGPIVNSVEYMFNGCKSRCVRCPDRDKYVRRMKSHHMNNAFLRLFEACLEAAPQLVFQLYVLITTAEIYQLRGVEGAWRVLTILSSWFSLAHTLTAFSKSRRNSDDALRPANLRHQIFHLLWRLAETGGRVLSLALFTSLFKVWLLAVLIPHGLVMALWQYLQERDAGFISVLEYFVYAYVFLFCFINNYSGGHSRIQYLAFYALFYAENLAMLGLWYWFVPERGMDGKGVGDGGEKKKMWWTYEATWYLVGGLASLPFHICLQLIYYRCCHPSSESIKGFVTRDREVWKQHLIGPFVPVSSGEGQGEEKQS